VLQLRLLLLVLALLLLLQHEVVQGCCTAHDGRCGLQLLVCCGLQGS
jgi:hypothetical protein